MLMIYLLLVNFVGEGRRRKTEGEAEVRRKHNMSFRRSM